MIAVDRKLNTRVDDPNVLVLDPGTYEMSKAMKLYQHYPDEELVRLLNSSEQAAFGAIYDRYWFALYNAAFYLLNDTDAAKDLLQDVFAWLWEHRLTLQCNNLKAYLHAAVRFKVANYIRSKNIRESFFEESTRVLTQQLAESSDEPLILQELQGLVRKAVMQLPDKCREVYLLSREGGLSNARIAEQLGISVKTVEAQMTIALKRLHSRLGLPLFLLLLWSKSLP